MGKEEIDKSYFGSKRYMDLETGEVIDAATWYQPIRGGDNDFDKVFVLAQVAEEYSDMIGKRFDVLLYVLNNRDKSKNIFIGTYEKIAKDLGFSVRTVQKAMTRIQEGKLPVLKKIQTGVYMINPAIICRHNKMKRMGLMRIFDEIDEEQEKQIEGQTEIDQEPKQEVS